MKPLLLLFEADRLQSDWLQVYCDQRRAWYHSDCLYHALESWALGRLHSAVGIYSATLIAIEMLLGLVTRIFPFEISKDFCE